VLKLFYDEHKNEFNAYGKVISGAISQGQSIKVLGQNFSSDEKEDMVI